MGTSSAAALNRIGRNPVLDEQSRWDQVGWRSSASRPAAWPPPSATLAPQGSPKSAQAPRPSGPDASLRTDDLGGSAGSAPAGSRPPHRLWSSDTRYLPDPEWQAPDRHDHEEQCGRPVHELERERRTAATRQSITS